MKKICYKRTLWALMLTIVLDTMGFLLIFPLFPLLLSQQHSLLVSSAATPFLHSFYYAIALAVWPIGNFFGTAFLGDLSDRIGRKNVLLLGLFMVFLTYALQGFAIYLHGLLLFIIARFVQGFFGGNYDIAQAAVADISPAAEKTRNMGLVALASSLGIVFGPILAAVATKSNAHTVNAILLPFWIASVLSFINLIWIYFVYQNTYRPREKKPIRLSKVFSAFLFVFQDKRVKQLGLIYFLLMAGWGLYIQQIPVVMQRLFHYSPHQMGYFFFALGLGFVIAMQFLQPRLVKKYHSKNIYIVAMFIVSVLLLIAGLYPMLDVEWIAVFLMSIFFVTGYGCLLAMVSDSVTADEQGQVMGGIGSAGSLAFAFTATSLAILSLINVSLPIIFALLISMIIGHDLNKNNRF